jgi:DegV family protein with EDD domain
MLRIVGDTTCVLPTDLCAKHQITIMPQMINFGEKSFRDDTELDTATFLRMLMAARALPKTAAPPPNLYAPVYKEALAAGDQVLVLCPSSDTSGTYRSAQIAAQEFDSKDIHIMDTRLLAGGLGRLLLLAAQWAEEGVNVETIKFRLEQWRKRERVYFVVDTLEYLAKGGRIGNAQALLGGILQIKPILTLRNGVNTAVESQRTKKRAVSRFKELILEECPPTPESYLCFVHSDAEEEALQYAEEFKQKLGLAEVPVYEQCPSIVVHVGPGVIAASFFRPE